MTNAELIKVLRCELYGDDECDKSDCPIWSELGCRNGIANRAAADALEAAEANEEAWSKKFERLKKRIAELEDELRFQLDTRRKETAEIERLKAENLKLQKQNRDCGWNCKQCEYVDKDLQAEEAEQRLMELDRRLYELRSFNAKMRGEHDEQ